MNKFDEMLRRDDLWFQVAITVAVLVFFSVGIGTLIALFAGSTASISDRIDIVYKLGLIGAGLITFCTVVWRGLLATQQVDAQRKQIEKLSSQIAMTEESNLAALLQKGAELISDDSKPGYVSAGIATLRAVLTSPNPKFAVEAMDLIADFIQANYRHSQAGVGYESASAALLAGERLGRISDRTLVFEAPADESGDMTYWVPVHGVAGVAYFGGDIIGYDFRVAAPVKARFHHVRIYGDDVVVTPRHAGCTFERCRIVAIQDDNAFERNTFKDCDFSNAKLNVSRVAITDLRLQGNYFSPDKPPYSPHDIDWLLMLETAPRSDVDEIPF
ncbi:hypothetical protein [Mesorhizobium loti]|uniref:Uncharacterized protein n=1 Tax=Rhizobium loti TaxID=381 RepID=A0A6M7U7L6_RHILI|nr:hypothetical protein [Mesorhizobium loti]OBQ72374.1 hypothetical protein A8145_06065 [Mesorhizobium loti]QKC72023.1 hypothetical protein EB815_24895 [Mesorhizobium loti]